MASSNPSSNTPAERIRWRDEEKADPDSGVSQRLGRRDSTDSLTIKRHDSRGRTDPALTLPIEYRTVSFQIEESRGKEAAGLAKAKNTTAQDLSDLEWHILSTHDVEERLSTSTMRGLSVEQAKQRVEKYGKNVFTPPKTPWARKIFGYFFQGFGSILFIGAILVFVSWKPLGDPPLLDNLALAIVLVAVFLIQAAFAMFQDWSTSRVMASIKNLLPEHSQVTRDGQLVEVPAEELAPGDLITIKAGNKLPADMRFIETSQDVKFDRSVLTGESVPISGSVNHTDDNYLETHNIGLQGTHCSMGSARAIVVSTGDKTVFGRIAKLTGEPKVKMTTMERELLYFVLVIVSIMVVMIIVIIVLWAAWLRKDHPSFINVPTLIVDCVSVAIAFIPEGLPIAVTAGLTITARLMKNNSILCKSLKTVETLGTVSVICSDKTGTLTEGKMTVTECAVAAEAMSAAVAMEQLTFTTGTNAPGVKSNAIHQLRAVAALCNAADFNVADLALPLARRQIFGDATDQAILRFAESLEDGGVAYMRACWNRVFELPFNSKNKFMIRCYRNTRPEALHQTLPAALADGFGGSDLVLMVKGAPDVLIDRCSHYVTSSGTVEALNSTIKSKFEQIKNSYSSEGKRCLLLARTMLGNNTVNAEPGTAEYETAMLSVAKSGLTLVGLVAIVDPLRADIRNVVTTLRGAGIKINMVTGDFALTAVAIAREAGIVTSQYIDNVDQLERQTNFPDSAQQIKSNNRKTLAISGPELMTLNENQWRILTEYEEVVFARTTPEQKLRIVREYQRDHVVAMTGDGVNDAPSLKAADVGISLGSGSDIAMEAADMVLLDSFSSIVVAVQYGRVVFDNLKKVVAYLLPAGSFSEFWPVFTSVAFGMPQILSSFLMIIICCFTDCMAATFLAYEKPEADVLMRPPRNVKKDRLVNWQLMLHAYGFIGILETIASFSMSFWYLQRQGIPFSDIWFSFGAVPPSIDPDVYAKQLNIASSIYFVNLVVMQWFNLLGTRTRRLSIFQHPPAFNKETQNLYLFPAILFAVVIAIFWLYPPVFQNVLGTAPIPAEYWFLPLSFGVGVLFLDEARKYIVKRWPDSVLGKTAW